MDIRYEEYEWVGYADGKVIKYDPKYKMTLNAYEKEREEEFWKCLKEGKPFNFYTTNDPKIN